MGISFLGSCSYNPAQPTTIYFSVGNAIAALALTIAIQQFLKPIYLFRLRAHGLKVGYLVLLVFGGFSCAFVGALLPNLPITHAGFFEYPVVWELLGSLAISFAYLATAFISLAPARLYRFNLISFVRAGAELLSSADDDDRAAFAEDLLGGKNTFASLIDFAKAFETAEHHATALKFELLKEQGKPLQFTERPPISAFYEFAHRRELTAASYAGSFLGIVSDPDFCSVLIRKCAWLTAGLLGELSNRQLYVSAARSFVQEVARQALINDDGIMAKEVRYDGFGHAPVLSNSLFKNPFLLRYYEPLQMHFAGSTNLGPGYVSRLGEAAALMLETALSREDYWGSHYLNGVEGAYESLFRQLNFRRYKGTPTEFMVGLHSTVEKLYDSTTEALAKLSPDRRRMLFVSAQERHQYDLVATIASIAYESLESIANGFLGPDDEAWFHAIEIFSKVFPKFGEYPGGMNPLQQHVAIKILAKLRHNMEGMYPSICRVLLAVVGPYDAQPQPNTRTAFVIIRDAVYSELKKLNALHAREPEKLGDYLPANVTYDAATDTLTHHYRSGDVQLTQLAGLQLPEVSFFDPANWQLG